MCLKMTNQENGINAGKPGFGMYDNFSSKK